VTSAIRTQHPGMAEEREGWQLGAPRRKKGEPRQRPTDSCTVQGPTSDGTLLPKKRAACLVFGFVGTDFHGLQCADRPLGATAEADESQPTTVADVLRSALLQSGAIAKSNLWPLARTKWTLASRTDKGVHAAAAAVSFRMETLAGQIVQCGGDGGGGGGGGGGDGGRLARPEGEGDWLLTEAEVARINGLLPPAVRLFGGGHVRKGFRARECASRRDYEYLLPAAALGSMAVDDFDALLQVC